MPGLTFVMLVVAIGLLVLIPTRRLFLGGWQSGPLTVYFLGMIVLGVLVAELRGPARYLVPILVLAYIAPFITVRQGLDRIRDRLNGGSRPPPAAGPGGAPDAPAGSARSAGSRAPDFRTPPRPRNVTPPEARPPESPS